MLTYEDCRDLSDLTQAEIDAIIEHEKVPAIIAADIGNYLLHTDDGVPVLRRMILDDIEAAKARGDGQHALTLRLVLRHFVETHPMHETGGAQ